MTGQIQSLMDNWTGLGSNSIGIELRDAIRNMTVRYVIVKLAARTDDIRILYHFGLISDDDEDYVYCSQLASDYTTYRDYVEFKDVLFWDHIDLSLGYYDAERMRT